MTATQTYQFTKTGIKWMPQIASHWKISRVKNYFTFTNEIAGDNYEDYKVLSLSVNGVIVRDMESGKGKFSLSMDLYQIVKPRSIVLCLFDMDVTPRIVGLCENLGIITNAYTSIFPKENVNERFYYYFFLQQDYNKSLKAQGTGVRTTLTNTQFGAVKIPVPPFAEQTAIANYLDDKCKKISHFITKKQRFIELLKEQRQSIINEAVVKGIDKDVKLKDSGIKWLGSIPEHWEVRRLGSIGKFFKGGNVSKADLIEDGEFAVVLYGDIYTKYEFCIKNVVNRINNEVAANAVLISQEDILFTGSGEDKNDIGKCVAFKGNEETYAGGDVIIFQQNEFDSEFIAYSQNSAIAKYQKHISSKGDIIVHTYASKLKDVKMPFPKSIEEQKQIVQYIKTETNTIDKAIAKAEREIELIKEYKEAMIAEAVMGKAKIYNTVNAK